MLSPDVDFSDSGKNSGINYASSFLGYKEMLTEDPESVSYERIFAEFDTAVLGKKPVLRDDFVLDDGDYKAEFEKFKSDLRAEEAADAEANKTPPPPPTPTLPSSPIQSDHRVSISITSQVSHTIAASSQVSNVVNTSTPPPEPEDAEAPPPAKKATRPAPKKKGRTKKPATTPDTTDAAPTQTGPAGQANGVPEELPTRVLRNRT